MARTTKKTSAAKQGGTKAKGGAIVSRNADTGRITDAPRSSKVTGHDVSVSAYTGQWAGSVSGSARGSTRSRRAKSRDVASGPGITAQDGGSLEELFQNMAESSAELAQRGIEIIEREKDEFASVGHAVADGLRQLFSDGFPEGGFDIAEAVQVLAAPRLWEERVGELLSPAEYSDVVGKSRQAVQQQITSGGLLAVRDRNARWRIPKWQVGMSAEARKALVSATRVLVEVGHLDPWSALAWTTEPHPEAAGAKPYLLVREQDGADKVVALAQRDGHAASQ